VTFETNDNISIRFKILNKAQLFDLIQNKKNTIRTALSKNQL